MKVADVAKKSLNRLLLLLTGLRAFNFIKKKFQRSFFPAKFAKFLRIIIFKNIYERLLLYLHIILFTMHEKDTANNARLELS